MTDPLTIGNVNSSGEQTESVGKAKLKSACGYTSATCALESWHPLAARAMSSISAFAMKSPLFSNAVFQLLDEEAKAPSNHHS